MAKVSWMNVRMAFDIQNKMKAVFLAIITYSRPEAINLSHIRVSKRRPEIKATLNEGIFRIGH